MAWRKFDAAARIAIAEQAPGVGRARWRDIKLAEDAGGARIRRGDAHGQRQSGRGGRIGRAASRSFPRQARHLPRHEGARAHPRLGKAFGRPAVSKAAMAAARDSLNRPARSRVVGSLAPAGTAPLSIRSPDGGIKRLGPGPSPGKTGTRADQSGELVGKSRLRIGSFLGQSHGACCTFLSRIQVP